MNFVKRFLIIFFVINFIFVILLLFVFKPINSIKDINSSPEIIITDKDNQPLMHLVNNHKITPIHLDEMNEKNIKILLTIEDKDFYKHNGFHLPRMMKTIFSNFKNKTSYGASTITQQYIKNVYLNQEKKFSRKIKELYYAIKLEQIASKDEILTNYLNCIYLGNDIYGLANASKYYFNKNYQDLTIQEMTTFVALLNAPTYYSNHLDQLEQRKNELLNILKKENVITLSEYQEARLPIHFNITKEIYPSNLLYFVDGVLSEYESFHIDAKFNEVITVKTNYHPSLNKHTFTSSGDYAYQVIDSNGYILCLVGGKNYYDSSFNIVFNGIRDIGSTIKPILYYEALKCGYPTNTTFFSGPYSFTYHQELITIKNNASIYPYRKIKMAEALATSDNIYAIKMHQQLGFKTLANHFKKYNIDAKALPSLALGSVGMSLKQLICIYSQFFTDGYYLTQRFIEQIDTGDTTIYKAFVDKQELGIKKYFQQIKQLMNGLFSPSIPHATASSIGSLLKTTCYGKSGLTDYDSYMIGFNEDILIGVWAGYLDNQKLENSKIKRLPKEIFLTLMNQYAQ